MTQPGDELNDVWSLDGKRVIARGDAAAIDAMLATSLEKVRHDASGWDTLYRHRKTGQYWELSYPRGEMQGGGPRRLRCLGENADNWAGTG